MCKLKAVKIRSQAHSRRVSKLVGCALFHFIMWQQQQRNGIKNDFIVLDFFLIKQFLIGLIVSSFFTFVICLFMQL